MAKQENDITKTGAQTFRQLQLQNALWADPSQFSTPEYEQGLAKKYFTGQQALGAISTENAQWYSTPARTPLFQQTGGKDYLGKSHFDPDILVGENELNNITDIRANNQPWYSKALSGIGKGTVLAGTTFVDGIVGLLAGVTTAAATGDISGLWDNPITQTMNDVNKWAESAMPNYYTEQELNGPWYGNIFTANFIFDKVVKNLGFMVGAAYSGGIYAKGINLAAKGFGRARAMYAASRAGMSAQEIVKASELGAQAAEAARGTRIAKGTVGAFFNAQAEATIEAVSNSDDFAENMTQQLEQRTQARMQAAQEKYEQNKGTYNITREGAEGTQMRFEDPAFTEYQKEVAQIRADYEAGIAEIENARKGMGMADYLFNIPILWIGDAITLGKFYAGGWKAARTEAKTATRATKQAMADAEAAAKAGDPDALRKLEQIVAKAERTGYQGLTAEEKALVEEVQTEYILPKWAGYTKAALRNPVKEGNEEMAQAAASRAAGNYYKSRLDAIWDAQTDPNSQQQVLSWIQAINKGFSEQYGDFNNYEEAFIGALTGILGSPTFGRSHNITNQTWLGGEKAIGFSGGVITDIRDYRDGRQTADNTAAYITKLMKSPDLENRLKHLVAQTTFDDIKQQAIIHDDKLAYKDAETAALFEDIMYLKKGQRLDLLQNAIQNLGMEFSDEEIQEIVSLTEKTASAYDERINDKVKRNQALATQMETLQGQIEATRQQMEQSEDKAQFEQLQKQYEELNTQYSQADREFRAINLYIEDSNPVRLSPYIKPDGTAMNADEIRADLNEKIQRIQTIIDDISEVQEDIDRSTGDSYTDKQLATLTWYSVMMRDWDRRSNGILREIKDQVALGMEAMRPVLDAIEQMASLEGIDGKPLYGGMKQGAKQWKNWQESIYEHLDKIIRLENEQSGAALALQLSDDTEIVTDKEKGTKEKYGEYLLKNLKQSVSNNPALQGKQAEIDYLHKQLDDLREIGLARRKYNQLLEEFRKNPEKITKAHEVSERKSRNKRAKTAAQAILNNFNWNAKIGEIAKTLQDQMTAIRQLGGMNTLLSEATDEQRKKLKAAQKLFDGVRQLKDTIEDVNISDRIKNAVNNVIDKNLVESNSFLELANSVRDSANEIDASDIPTEFSEQFHIVQELLDPANISEITKNLDEIERKRDTEFEELMKKKAHEIQEEKTLVEEPTNAPTEGEEPMESPEDEGESQEDVSNDEPTEDSKDNEAVASANSNINNDLNTDNRGILVNRRQLTETYLHDPSMSLYDYYNANRKNIPAGVDPERFLTYIKATTDYLTQNGAFDYIRKGLLHKGDVITFGMDEALNEEAGTKVVLMYVTDKDGNKQVVGSIRTEFEFAQYRAKKTKNLAVEAQEALYKAVVDGAEVNTKVDSQIGGVLPLADGKLDSTLAAIFGDNKAVLAVAKTGGFTATLNNVEVLSKGRMKNGQVYVLIPTNTGKYIPALCVSQRLSELNTDSWYYQHILIPEMQILLNNPTMVNLTQMRRSFSTRLHVQRGIMGAGGFTEVRDGEKATHIRVGLKAKGNNRASALNFTVEIPDGGFTQEGALDVIQRIVNSTQGQRITTRLDIKRLRGGNDTEYAKNILATLTTNLMVGERGQHSINDGFLYEPTDIERKVTEKGTTHSATSRRKPASTPGNITTVKAEGVDMEVSGTGVVTRNGKVITDEELAAKAVAAARAEAAPIQAPAEPKKQAPAENSNLGGIASRRRVGKDVQLGVAGTRRSNNGTKRLMVAPEVSTEPMSSEEQLQHNLEEVRRMFPALGKQGRIVLLNGMIHTADENGNPVKAFGMFKNGVLYISSNSPMGTAYHEAFHYMTSFLLDDAGKERLLEVAREQFGDLEELALEEKMAEKFREYVNGFRDNSLKARIKRFFQSLKRLIDSFRGRENYLDTLFYNIYKGSMAERDTEDNYHERLLEYRRKQLSYDNLSKDDKSYIAARKVTQEEFEALSVEQREIFLHCM